MIRTFSQIACQWDVQFKENEIDGTCSMNGDMNVEEILLMKPEGYSAFPRSSPRWKSNPEMDLKIVGYRCVDSSFVPGTNEIEEFSTESTTDIF
jgi:hypothetical protein